MTMPRLREPFRNKNTTINDLINVCFFFLEII